MLKPKILIYGMDDWSHARVYWDLVNNLTEHFTIDYISWYRSGHDLDWRGLAAIYSAILIDMDSVLEHLDTMFLPCEVREKILLINHGPQQVADYTFKSKSTRLQNYTDKELLAQDLNLFKLIACVSPNTIHSVKKETPSLANKLRLTSLGVNENNFPKSTFTREKLNSLGYFTHVDSTKGQGMDTKRGFLAHIVARNSGVPMHLINDVNFKFMDLWYKQIDVYLMTSIYESGPLPLLEAGVCGIPIIASPAGLAPQFLSNGGGVLTETFDENEYIRTAVNTIAFWRENPTQLKAESIRIRENTLEYFTWGKVKQQWIDVINEFIA